LRRVEGEAQAGATESERSEYRLRHPTLWIEYVIKVDPFGSLPRPLPQVDFESGSSHPPFLKVDNFCKPLYKGSDGIRRWVGLGVIADNVIHIGVHLAERSR